MMKTRQTSAVHSRAGWSERWPNWKLAVVSLSLVATRISQADVVFDNISNYQNGVPGANISSSSAAPNTFMGGGFTLTPGTISLTGFDLYPVNLSATSFTGLKINIFVWGTVNTSGTVNAGTPAFGDLLGSYTFTRSGSFSAGTFSQLEGLPPGSNPGITLATPLPLSSTTIGLSFNYEGTTDGVTYNSVNNLTSVISYGTPASSGAEVFNGFYRNANGELDGNFTSTLRSLGLPDQSLGLRIYGVPEPGILALAGLGAVALAVFRRRK